MCKAITTRGPCRCEQYVFARTVNDWLTCECGHTRQIHEKVTG